MDKKANFLLYDMILKIPSILFVSISAIITFLLLILLFMSPKFAAEEAEAITYIDALIYSPHGMAYYDPILLRYYSNIVDVRKLNYGLFDNFKTQKQVYVQIILNYNGQKINIANNAREINWADIRATSGYSTINLLTKTVRNDFVYYYLTSKITAYDGNNYYPADLYIYVVIPR